MRYTDKDPIEDTKDQALISILTFLFELFFDNTSLRTYSYVFAFETVASLCAGISLCLQFHLHKQHERQLVVKEPVN